MKINWGTGIVIVIAIFLVGMAVLVYISSSQDLNLVTPDYYPKGMDYQTQIDKKNRTAQLEHKVEITQDANYIYINFPSVDSVLKPTGEILLFFPINDRLDRRYKIATNDQLSQMIAKDSLVRSRCIVKIDWQLDSINGFYQEESIMLK